jgi:hypothetical protein
MNILTLSLAHCRMEQEWKKSQSILRLLVLLLLVSTTEAATTAKLEKMYPQAALQANACFSTFCTPANALYHPLQQWKATFSSQDERWNYSPKNIFNKDLAGSPGQWEEGSYLCSDGTPIICTIKDEVARGLTGSIDGGSATYKGEWVRLLFMDAEPASESSLVERIS